MNVPCNPCNLWGLTLTGIRSARFLTRDPIIRFSKYLPITWTKSLRYPKFIVQGINTYRYGGWPLPGIRCSRGPISDLRVSVRCNLSNPYNLWRLTLARDFEKISVSPKCRKIAEYRIVHRANNDWISFASRNSSSGWHECPLFSFPF